MALNSLEAIEQADQLEHRWVDVPEWGDGVWIRQLTAGEFADMVDYASEHSGERMMFLLVAACLVDEESNRIADFDQVERIAGRSREAIQRIFREANDLTGLFQPEAEKKDSETGPSADSSTS